MTAPVCFVALTKPMMMILFLDKRKKESECGFVWTRECGCDGDDDNLCGLGTVEG